MMIQGIILAIAAVFTLAMAVEYYLQTLATKFIVIALGAVLCNMVYFSLDTAKGWPTNETNDISGYLRSIDIISPSRPDGKDGGIYLTIIPQDRPMWYEYRVDNPVPRLYEIPYTDGRAQKFKEAKKAMEQGMLVKIEGIPNEDGTESNGVSTPSDMDASGGERDGNTNKNSYTPTVPNLQYVDPRSINEKEVVE